MKTFNCASIILSLSLLSGIGYSSDENSTDDFDSMYCERNISASVVLEDWESWDDGEYRAKREWKYRVTDEFGGRYARWRNATNKRVKCEYRHGGRIAACFVAARPCS